MLASFSHKLIGFLAVTVMAVTVSTSPAATITLTAIKNGTGIDHDLNGTFEEFNSPVPFGYAISIRKFNSFPNFQGLEQRSFIEFNISTLPDNAVITDVQFLFQVVGYTSNATGVDIAVYKGNGLADVSDLTSPAELVGGYNPNDIGLNDKALPLMVEPIQDLVDTSNYLGLRFLATDQPENTQLASYSFTNYPQLQITFVPEVQTFVMTLIALIPVAGIAIRRHLRD